MESVLKISEGANLAIHAVTIVALAGGRRLVKITELSDTLGASLAHLGKVMNRLARAKYVVSKRGPQGGFVLGPAAAEASMLDICELMDGPMSKSACLFGRSSCRLGACVLGSSIEQMSSFVRGTLAGIKISDIGLKNNKSKNGLPKLNDSKKRGRR